ncbi:MAG: prolipoprotein diacylglyceryl transferase [Candidatus Acidiferrales bacterium]
MHPVLFQFGSITIYTYGVLVATGVLLGLWYARRQAKFAGLDPDRVWNLGIYVVLTALVTAKLWLVALYFPYYLGHPREIFSIGIVQSGGTFYGGVIGALTLVGVYTYRTKMPVLPLLDCFSGGLPLGHAIGRLGCFMAGCCYGKPTDLPWGVTFHDPVAAQLVGTPIGVPLHPTQLYEAAAEFCNFLLLVWMGKRQQFSGQILATYLVLYGIERGSIEFVRGDPDRTLLLHGAISLMQIVSVAFILVGGYLWWRGLRKQMPVAPTRA